MRRLEGRMAEQDARSTKLESMVASLVRQLAASVSSLCMGAVEVLGGLHSQLLISRDCILYDLDVVQGTITQADMPVGGRHATRISRSPTRSSRSPSPSPPV